MSIDEQHVALPKLYGAPAYARPAPHREETPRPFDPDELPIEAAMTDDDRNLAADLLMNIEGGDADGDDASGGLRPRAFSIKSLAERLLGNTKIPG